MAFLDGPRPIAVAHRGGTESAPENTVAAFRAAQAQGFRYLETDVHLSADGVLVAFHDDVLDRVTDTSGAIADLHSSDIAAARLGDGHTIPTFAELLETFPDARFNVDPKSDDSVVALVQTLRHHGAIDRVCIGAFSDQRLGRVRALAGPGLCTSAGPREIVRAAASSRIRPARRPAHHSLPYRCLQLPVRHRNVELVTPALVGWAHDRDLQVHVWTIDDPVEMHRLLDLGVDGIMTDHPTVLRTVLESRHQWFA